MFKKKKTFVLIIIIFIITLALNICARFKAFCDWYTSRLFRYVSYPLLRFSGLFSVSVGQIIIFLGLISIVFLLALLLGVTFAKVFKIETIKLKKMLSYLIRFLLIMIALESLIITLNCSIPYNCSKLEVDNNKNQEKISSDYKADLDEIRRVRNMLLLEANSLSLKLKRDNDGNIVDDGNLRQDINEAVRSYSIIDQRFSLYVPDYKSPLFSYIMYESDLIGVYFPFSMEANVSKYLTVAQIPYTACHELSHLKGYMYEGEANYLSYLICVNSDDDLIRYSGIIGVLRFIDNDYYELDPQNYENDIAFNNLVIYDMRYYDAGVYDEIEELEKVLPIKKEDIHKAGQEFTDTYLNYYGASANYSEVTSLILRYYKDCDEI